MTPPAKAALIKYVQTGKRWLRLEDDAYHAALARCCNGKTSSKACSTAELRRLAEHFHDCGFPRLGKSLTAKQRKMWVLWQSLYKQGRIVDKSMKALLSWIEGQTDGIKQLGWLTPAQENTLIESLKKWSARDD